MLDVIIFLVTSADSTMLTYGLHTMLATSADSTMLTYGLHTMLATSADSSCTHAYTPHTSTMLFLSFE